MEYALPIAYALVLWWFATGVIFFLDQLPVRTFKWSMAGGTALLAATLWVVWAERDDSTLFAVYASFTAGVLAWGWQELSLYTGFVTGPRKQSCAAGGSGWRHFGHALGVNLWHEIAIVAVALAIPTGVLAAWKARKLVDRLVMGFAVLGFAMPVFVLAYVLIYFFAVQWQLLPVQGYKPIGEGFWPFFECLILPSVALGVTYMALIARITRASMLEVLAQDYIRTANAKGLATDRVLLLHALKNAAVPIITVIGIGIALLISGVVITETVFNIPGLGRLTVDAVLKRDYPVVQGLILVFAAAKVLVNLIIDISYAFLDPRIRY